MTEVINKRLMRQAIEVKTLNCTDYRDTRVKAWSHGTWVTLLWNHNLNVDENHNLAAVKLAEKLEWNGKMIGGVLKSGNYVYVFVEEH